MKRDVLFVEGLSGLATLNFFDGEVVGVEMPRGVVEINISGNPKYGYPELSPVRAALNADLSVVKSALVAVVVPDYLHGEEEERDLYKINLALGIVVVRLLGYELDVKWLLAHEKKYDMGLPEVKLDWRRDDYNQRLDVWFFTRKIALERVMRAIIK